MRISRFQGALQVHGTEGVTPQVRHDGTSSIFPRKKTRHVLCWWDTPDGIARKITWIPFERYRDRSGTRGDLYLPRVSVTGEGTDSVRAIEQTQFHLNALVASISPTCVHLFADSETIFSHELDSRIFMGRVAGSFVTLVDV